MSDEPSPDSETDDRTVTEADALSPDGRRYRTLILSKSGEIEDDE